MILTKEVFANIHTRTRRRRHQQHQKLHHLLPWKSGSDGLDLTNIKTAITIISNTKMLGVEKKVTTDKKCVKLSKNYLRNLHKSKSIKSLKLPQKGSLTR
jgi:hypothetical protein